MDREKRYNLEVCLGGWLGSEFVWTYQEIKIEYGKYKIVVIFFLYS